MKTYLEIKVPISFDAPWFLELRESLKDIPVRWQKGFYHITMAFLDDTQNLPGVEAIMHKYLDHTNAVTITFDKLDVFTASHGMLIVYLTTSYIPETFQSRKRTIWSCSSRGGRKKEMSFIRSIDKSHCPTRIPSEACPK